MDERKPLVGGGGVENDFGAESGGQGPSCWRCGVGGRAFAGRREGYLLFPTPSTLRNLGFQCACLGFQDSPAEPTDHFQGLDLFKPQTLGPRKFHEIHL